MIFEGTLIDSRLNPYSIYFRLITLLSVWVPAPWAEDPAAIKLGTLTRKGRV